MKLCHIQKLEFDEIVYEDRDEWSMWRERGDKVLHIGTDFERLDSKCAQMNELRNELLKKINICFMKVNIINLAKFS